MAGWIDSLRSGAWLTAERMRITALAVLVAGIIGAAFLIATSNGLNDRFRRPLGTDFSDVYAAGTYVLDGKPSAPFDPARQHAREQAIFGPATPFYGWHYPPFFLGVAALFATMHYPLALALWQGVTLVVYLLVIRAILTDFLPSPLWEGSRAGSARGGGLSIAATPHPAPSAPTSLTRGEVKKEWLLLALAFPAVFINLGHGHNGFLTAALFGGALTQLDRRPALAGVLIGCLVYKPQFGLLLPLVLAASGRWRAFAAAAATVVVLTFAVTFAFGTDIWTAFRASTIFTRVEVLERGGTGWQKIQSVFSVVRMWGGGIPLAYAVQGTVTVAVAATLAWLWRRRSAYPLQAAALLIGTILATPYSLDYDLMLLAPAIAFLAADGLKRGFVPYEKTILAALWIVPLVTRSVAGATSIPLAVPAMIVAFLLLLHRAITENDAVQTSGVLRSGS
jgi:hypothetical protein